MSASNVTKYVVEVSAGVGTNLAHIKSEGGAILASGLDDDPAKAILLAAKQLAGEGLAEPGLPESEEESCDGCGEPFGEYDGRYHKHCG
jgi:hypothetical protein